MNKVIQKIYEAAPEKVRNEIYSQNCKLSFEKSFEKLLDLNLDISKELNQYLQDLKEDGYPSPQW